MGKLAWDSSYDSKAERRRDWAFLGDALSTLTEPRLPNAGQCDWSSAPHSERAASLPSSMTAHDQSVTHVSGTNRNPCVRNGQGLDTQKTGAGEGIRTLDPDLGKVVLYP
jgi:hypothetical protein